MSDTSTPNPADSTHQASGDGDQKPNTVTRDAFDRLLGEKKTKDVELREAKARLQAYDEEKRLRDEDEAAKRGDFEKAREADRKRIEELEGRTKSLTDEKIENRKFSAFIRSLGTALDPKFLPLLDLDHIKADEDGNIDEASVTKYSNEFKTHYADILTKPGTTNFPDSKPKGGNHVPWASETTTRSNLKERKDSMSDAVEKRKRELGIN